VIAWGNADTASGFGPNKKGLLRPRQGLNDCAQIFLGGPPKIGIVLP